MHIEFYITTASIIPLLFLGVSLQSTFIVRKKAYSKKESFPRNIHIAAFVMLVFIMALGEFASLKDIYLGSFKHSDLISISAALIIPTLFICTDYVLFLLNQSKLFWYLAFLTLGLCVSILLPFSL